jgi:hypothetical protein
VEHEDSGPCVDCKGSGVVTKPSDYPGLEDQRWCQNCRVGKAKASRVVAIVMRPQSERKVKAA